MVRNLNYNFWKNKKVFITGHTGFKGSWMTSWLIKLGANVKGFSLPVNDSNYLFKKIRNSIEKNIENSYGNMLDITFLKSSIKSFQPDIIFHFAAQPLVLHSYKDPIGTWETNLMGTINVLSSLEEINKECILILVTTDKVYKNKESKNGYRETDELGGYDPYSASKAACELAISSWRSSLENKHNSKKDQYKFASVRAGNVIGGGDWAANRIVPDVIKSLMSSKKVHIRNPKSTRPWQHVLEPLLGYLFLAESLSLKGKNYCESFNFGPNPSSNKEVKLLVERIFNIWPGEYIIENNKEKPYESKLLNLNIDKSAELLNWFPKWDFNKTIDVTIDWYKNVFEGNDPYAELVKNIIDYESY
tara:strand:- start:550 stop:1632 length:1083 start_codon:yes stop_codon:yes gene_type:complete